MKCYVCGFAFNRMFNTVALIRKLKPDWQKGCLNGIGGKIKDGERPIEAMVREFAEEAGVQTPEENWIRVVVLRGPDFIVHCFAAVVNLELVQSMESEKVELTRVADVASQLTIDNIPWLVYMSQNRLIVEFSQQLQADESKGRPFVAEVTYADR